jgi:hypothetical protein
MSNLGGIDIRLQATYVRLIYTASAANDPAARSCMRPVNGTATYEVTGWFYESKTAVFLIPTTLINFASLILFLMAMYRGDHVLYQTDPTNPESLLSATKGIYDDGSKIVVELAHGGKDDFWGVSWMPFSCVCTDHILLHPGSLAGVCGICHWWGAIREIWLQTNAGCRGGIGKKSSL